MRRSVALLAAGLVAVMPVGSWVGPSVADAVSAGCTSTDPAPEVLGVTATDVVMRRESVRYVSAQSVRATTRNACGGGYEYQGCSFDPPRPCTGADVTMRRTADAPSKARRCGRFLNTYDDGAGSGPSATSDPDVYLVDLAEWWETHDDSDDGQPGFTNACAGAWDVTVVAANTWTDGRATGAPFTQTRAFSLRRWSHLTTDAGPEPVRAGALVTVRGRLVRADWNVDRNVGYAEQRVQLQRRTPAGSYRTLRTVRTDREGRLRTTLRALSTERCYRWRFAGSATTASVASFGDCVPVRS